MGEITEVFEDIREKIGDKWFFIFIGVAVLFGLYNLVKGSENNTDKLVPVTSIASYPDAVTNANVIIDTLQDSLQYTEDRIMGNIDQTHEEISEELTANFTATNDYINKGFASQEKLLLENFDEMQGTLDTNFADIKQSQTAITGQINTMKNDIASHGSAIQSLSGSVSSLGSTVSGLGSQVSGLGSQVSNLANKVTTTTKTPSTSTGSTTKKESNTLTYTTKAGLNTNTSIVDALKATGTDSSFANRAKIYYANGGKGTYTGSYSQNVSMLNSLKAGTLKKG